MSSAAQPLEAIAGFAGLLREHGLTVGIAEHQAMVRAALALPVERHAQLEAAWRAIACHDRRDWLRWSDLFARYWKPGRTQGQSRVSGQTRPSRSMQQLVQSLHDSLAAGSPKPSKGGDAALSQAVGKDEDGASSPRAQSGASLSEALHDRSFSQWLPQDLTLLDQLAEQIARRLRRQLTRRWREQAGGRQLDIRRTLRASLRTGGLPLNPAWRAPRRERPRLFILVDVSRSMETHAQLFLRIARAFVHAIGARVFVFHTRLAEVTPLLRSDSAAVQEKVNAVTAGFGGGTRIATSIDDFRQLHARTQLGRRARVWLLSDGFDADPPERLAEALSRVRAGGARIRWFHPSERPPASQSMQALLQQAPGTIEGFHRLNHLGDLADLTRYLR